MGSAKLNPEGRELAGKFVTDFNAVKMSRILNSELADVYGNLLSRCTGKAVNKNQMIPRMPAEETPSRTAALRLLEHAMKLPSEVSICMQSRTSHDRQWLSLHKFTEAVFGTLITLPPSGELSLRGR